MGVRGRIAAGHDAVAVLHGHDVLVGVAALVEGDDHRGLLRDERDEGGQPTVAQFELGRPVVHGAVPHRADVVGRHAVHVVAGVRYDQRELRQARRIEAPVQRDDVAAEVRPGDAGEEDRRVVSLLVERIGRALHRPVADARIAGLGHGLLVGTPAVPGAQSTEQVRGIHGGGERVRHDVAVACRHQQVVLDAVGRPRVSGEEPTTPDHRVEKRRLGAAEDLVVDLVLQDDDQHRRRGLLRAGAGGGRAGRYEGEDAAERQHRRCPTTGTYLDPLLPRPDR